MSTEHIRELHERASERYLSGDYQGALEAWRDILGLDPADEQALGGVRLASQFVERTAPAFAEAATGVEQELEQGLRVLDGLGATATEESLEGWDQPAAPSGDSEAFGLESVPWPSPDAPPSSTAASVELRRRVDDLLAQARSKVDAGERDEALAVLARLSILDEDNVEAQALRSKLDAAGASDLDKVERAIIEGVAALESDHLDEAERLFQEALALSPQHREAQHYLEKIAERRGSGEEELLGATGGDAAPAEDAVQRAIGHEAVPHEESPPPKAPAPWTPRATSPADLSEPPPAASAPRFALPPPKVLLLGGVGAVALVCAAIALPSLLGGSAAKTAAAKTSAPKLSESAPRPARAARSGPAPKAAGAAPAPIVPTNPEELAKAFASALATARSRMASEDFGGAVVAFNEALTLNPGNAEAEAGIEDAGERYKKSKAEREALNSIKLAFRDGEFTSGLRLAYRLPPSVSASYVDGIKVSGWYNLAVVALRAGDCREALSHLDEALDLAPADPDVKKLREFAARYADAVKDRVFLDRVEALSFRPLPSS